MEEKENTPKSFSEYSVLLEKENYEIIEYFTPPISHDDVLSVLTNNEERGLHRNLSEFFDYLLKNNSESKKDREFVSPLFIKDKKYVWFYCRFKERTKPIYVISYIK